MNNIYIKLSIILLITCFLSCKKHSDNAYLNGDTLPINSKSKIIEQVALNPVSLEGSNFGIIAVYDSLMFYMNSKLPNHFFNVFNLGTGEEIGTFIRKGQGPNDVIAISPIFQFFEEENEVKTLLFAANENKILKWNITQSIKKNTTEIDTIISYNNYKELNGARYNYIFCQNKDTLYTSIQSIPINEDDASLPFYQKRTLYTNKTLKDYPIYRKSIKNGEASIIPETFFASNDAFKPDGSKIVQAMLHLNQINIIDTKTGKITGYRMNGSPDFSIFKHNKKRIIDTYYLRTQADNQYIYATYWGKKPWGDNQLPFLNTIYVFDWDGCLLYELVSDHPIHEIWLDNIRNRLYTTNTDEVFYINLKEIINYNSVPE